MDIGIAWDPVTGRGDWVLQGGDLATAPDVESLVLVALFTDRVASADYVPPDGSGDRRGWWGDGTADSPIGSRLWQLMPSVKTDQVTLPQRARDYCREALQDLVTDGLLTAVQVDAGWLTPTALGIAVRVTEPGGTTTDLSYRLPLAAGSTGS